MDLAESDSIARLATAVAERWDRLDILIVNAAFLPLLTLVTQIEPKSFNQTLRLNVLATQALLAAFDPLLKRSEAGRVIGLTSSVGESPRAYWVAYGATKAAFETLLACHSQEVERISNTRVVILDPGATRTQMRSRATRGQTRRRSSRSRQWRSGLWRCWWTTSPRVTGSGSRAERAAFLGAITADHSGTPFYSAGGRSRSNCHSRLPSIT